MTLTDTAHLLDLSPRRAAYRAAELAPTVDPGREPDDPTDPAPPIDDYRWPLGAGLPRTYPREEM